MPIRWKNDLVRPLTTSSWLLFMCRYPATFLVPAAGLLVYAGYWWRWLTAWEAGQASKPWMGRLGLLYDLLGKYGVVGFYLLLGAGFGYLFWYYAVREPHSY